MKALYNGYGTQFPDAEVDIMVMFHAPEDEGLDWDMFAVIKHPKIDGYIVVPADHLGLLPRGTR